MRPIKIEINNLFKYGKKDNVFTFERSELTLIVGPNGAGKSSIFEAMSFALFEQTIRWGLTKKEILRRGAEQGFARFTFEHNGNRYEVTRTRSEKGSGSVVFENIETGERIGRGQKGTNDAIVKCIGFDFDAFRNSVLFGQHDLAKVVSLRSGDRLELLTNFLGLNILDRCFEISRGRVASIRGEIEGLDAEIELRNKLEMKRQLKTMREIESEHIKTVEEAEVKYGDLKELVKKLTNMEAACQRAKSAIKYHKEEMRSLVDQKKGLENISGEGPSVEEITEQIDSIEQERKKLPSVIESRESIEEKVQEHNESVLSAKGDIRQIRNRVSQIRRRKHCSECERPIDQETKERLIKKQKSKLEKAEAARDKAKQNLNDAKARLKEAKKEEDRLRNLPDEDTLFDRLGDAKRRERLLGEMDNIEERITSKKKQIAKSKSVLDAAEDEGYSTDRLERLKKSLLKIKGDLSESEAELRNTRENIKKLQDGIREVKTMETLRDEFVSSLRKAEFVFDVFSKTGGIRQVIVENVLPVLNSKINSYLEVLTDEGISVEFTTGTKTKKGTFKNKLEIMIVSPDGIADFASYSGGEKQTIILAIGLGISELAAESVGMDCEVLLMDEVFSSLDSGARRRLVRLMYALQKKFKNVVAISHIKELKNQMPNVVRVVRKNGLSRVKQ